MKAVLTIEMPRNCAKCPLAEEHPIPFSQEVLFQCRIRKQMVPGVKRYGRRAIGKRPEWCPLREMPERDVKMYCGADYHLNADYVDGYKEGWADCLGEIEGRNDG